MSSIMDMIRIAPTLPQREVKEKPKSQYIPTGRPANYRKARQGGWGRTPSQDAVVAFVNARVEATGAPPTRQEIQKHMGWKASHSVKDVLFKVVDRLDPRAKGLVRS